MTLKVRYRPPKVPEWVKEGGAFLLMLAIWVLIWILV